MVKTKLKTKAWNCREQQVGYGTHTRNIRTDIQDDCRYAEDQHQVENNWSDNIF